MSHRVDRPSAALLLVGALLAACATPARPAVPALTPAAPASGNRVLTVVTHDSFGISPDVLAEFEGKAGAKVQVLKAGDAGEVLNKSILAKANPLGDVLFGVDNTFLSRALDADLFEPYSPAALAGVPAELKLDPSHRLTPVDYGYVTLNYDLAWFAQRGVAVPRGLKDLLAPELKGKLVVQNPATSSPGLGFLLATVAAFGDDGAYTWREFWRDLRANDVLVTSGWEQAYYDHFSAASGSQGSYPLVVSYSTSPAAEVFFSEGKRTEPPSGNLSLPQGAFRQVEFAGILKGAREPALARAFIDFMLAQRFQSDIPLNMFMYPAVSSAAVPDVFTKFAQAPTQPAAVAPSLIASNRERWIREWTQIVLR